MSAINLGTDGTFLNFLDKELGTVRLSPNSPNSFFEFPRQSYPVFISLSLASTDVSRQQLQRW